MTTKTDDIQLPPLPGGYAMETAAAMRNYARAAVEADRQGRMPSDEVTVVGMPEFDALLDHIYEYGTVSEGVLWRANRLASALLSRYGSQPATSTEPPKRPYGTATMSEYGIIPECDVAPVAAQKQPVVTDEMVTRFLGWHLPKDFAPDAGISFNPSPNPLCWPVGTNLFTDPQARAMLEYVLQGAPISAPTPPAAEQPSAQGQEDSRRGYAGVTVWIDDFQTTRIVPKEILEGSRVDHLRYQFEAARRDIDAARAAKKKP